MEGVSSHTVKKNHVEWEISLQSFLRKCSLPYVAYEWVTGLGESSSHTFYLVRQCIIYQCITFSDLGVFPSHLRVKKAKVNKQNKKSDLPKSWSVADLGSAGRFLFSRFGNVYV